MQDRSEWSVKLIRCGDEPNKCKIEVSGQLHVRTALSPRIAPSIHMMGSVEHQSGSEHTGKPKNLLLLAELERRSSNLHPVTIRTALPRLLLLVLLVMSDIKRVRKVKVKIKQSPYWPIKSPEVSSRLRLSDSYTIGT